MFQKWQGAEFSWIKCPLVGDRCTGPGDSAVNVILRTGLYLTGEREAIGSVVDWGLGGQLCVLRRRGWGLLESGCIQARGDW